MADPIRVLLVDDHAVVREGLRAFLELQDGIEIAGEAGVVNRHDRLGAGRDGVGDPLAIDIERRRIDVDQYRLSAHAYDAHCGRAEGKIRGDDFITGSYAVHGQGDLETGRAGGDRNRVYATAHERRKILLEGLATRPGGQPARFQAFGDRVDFVLADIGAGERYRLGWNDGPLVVGGTGYCRWQHLVHPSPQLSPAFCKRRLKSKVRTCFGDSSFPGGST